MTRTRSEYRLSPVWAQPPATDLIARPVRTSDRDQLAAQWGGCDGVQLIGSLAAVGVDEVGAIITDGNTASERLFLGFGFTRRGPWD